jgi:acetyl esterase/lipase
MAEDTSAQKGYERKMTDEEVLEECRAAFPWRRIEPRPDTSYRYDYRDFHPQYMSQAYVETNPAMAGWCDPRATREELRAVRDQVNEGMVMIFQDQYDNHPEWQDHGVLEEHFAPACPEEPDAPEVRVLVWRQKGEGLHPTLFQTAAGMLFLSAPEQVMNIPMANYLGCNIVAPQWRSYADAPYPAGINDFHAAYQWMVDNAEELGVDPDRVVIIGNSGGGLVSAATAFRLKRYGWCGAPMPRGVFVLDGMWDDFETCRSTRVLGLNSYALSLREAFRWYLGDNFASGLIGPEGVPNHATVDECRDMPPFLITATQDFWGCDAGLEFVDKLNRAGIYCEYFMQGGMIHGMAYRKDGVFYSPCGNLDVSEYRPREGTDIAVNWEHVVVGALKEYLAYDFRRPMLSEPVEPLV